MTSRILGLRLGRERRNERPHHHQGNQHDLLDSGLGGAVDVHRLHRWVSREDAAMTAFIEFLEDLWRAIRRKNRMGGYDRKKTRERVAVIKRGG